MYVCKECGKETPAFRNLCCGFPVHTTDGKRCYAIPSSNIYNLREKIKSMNKRAVKLNCPPIVFDEIDKVAHQCKTELGTPYVKYTYIVTVEGEAPKLNGWTFIGAITPQPSGENLIRCVPNEEVPEEYRDADPLQCDHCHTRRKRNDVFIIRHEDGHHAQVGSTCLTDFLGGVNPQQAAERATWLIKLAATMGEAEDGPFGGKAIPTYDLVHFATVCALVVRRLGWVSRGEAFNDESKTPTSDYVIEYLNPPVFSVKAMRAWEKWIDDNNLDIKECDSTTGQNAVEWGQSLSSNVGNDYLYNLGVVCRTGFVQDGGKGKNTVGVAASLIKAYQRNVERERAKKEKQKSTAHLTHVGEIASVKYLTTSRSFSPKDLRDIMGFVPLLNSLMKMAIL